MAENESVLVMETTAQPADAAASWRLGFWSLIVTQFQGAFSDNALKWLVSFFLLGMGLEQGKRDLLFVLVVPLRFSPASLAPWQAACSPSGSTVVRPGPVWPLSFWRG